MAAAGGDPVQLPDVRLKLKTHFASLIFTSLDNQPLWDSQRILTTALTRDKQTGGEYNASKTELLRVGGPPLLLEPVQAHIQLLGSPPTRMRPLDPHGVPHAQQSVAIEADGSFQIDGRYATDYYESRR